MTTLHGFVSARLADLSTAGGFTVRARDMCRTAVSAAVSARTAPRAEPAAPQHPTRIVIGHDLPRISPGIERC